MANLFGQSKCFLVHHSSPDSRTHCSFLPNLLRCSGCNLWPVTEGPAHTCRNGASGFVVWVTPSPPRQCTVEGGTPQFALCLHYLSSFEIMLEDAGFRLPLLWGPSLALLEKPGFPKSLPCWAADGNITPPAPQLAKGSILAQWAGRLGGAGWNNWLASTIDYEAWAYYWLLWLK